MNRTSACRNTGYGLLRAVAVLAITADVTGVHAQPSPQPAIVRASLSVDADERCATGAALAERVRARSERVRFVDDAPDVPRLSVRIGDSSARGRVAELSVQWPDGRRAERRLNVQSCASALDALALLLAMTLDPDTRGDAGTPTTGAGDAAGTTAGGEGAGRGDGAEDGTSGSDATGGEDAPGDTSSVDDAAAATADQAAVSEQPSADVEDGTQHADEASAPDAVPSDAGDDGPHPLAAEALVVGVNGQLASQLLPEPMPGLGLHALLALEGAGAWAPALELRLAHAWLHDLAQSGGNASFELDSARLLACLLGLRLGPLAGRACASGAIGRLSAGGSDSYVPQEHARLWSSLGGALLLSVGLGERVELEGGFELTGPLSRYGFAFAPEVFHRVPAVFFLGHFGVGVRFP